MQSVVDELEDAHRYLDVVGVPRKSPQTGNELTLAGRISEAVNRSGRPGRM